MKRLLWGVLGLASTSCAPLTVIPAPPTAEPARSAPAEQAPVPVSPAPAPVSPAPQAEGEPTVRLAPGPVEAWEPRDEKPARRKGRSREEDE